MNILLLSHQLDFSGAPIALLRLAETLINQGHSLSLASINDGPLGIEFGKLGIKQFNPAMEKKYDCYFANTFLTVPAALNFSPTPEKVIAWIHESRIFFKLYGINEAQYGLSQLKRAVFPSKFMFDEYANLMPQTELSQLRNLVSMDAIVPNDTYKDYIAVTGSWEPRKNQSLLLKRIEQNKLNVRFNFIGAQKPSDISISNHNFFGQVPLVRAKKLIASSFGLISAAQSETQNLAAIEAMMIGNPVLLSDIPAHRELQDLIPEIPLFDLSDSASFSNGFDCFQNLKNQKYILDKNIRLCDSFFGQSAFGAAVRKLFL